MNVLFVGEGSAGTHTLQALAGSKHRIVAVLSSPPGPKWGSGSVWNLARKLGYAPWPARLVKDPSLAERIRAAEVDILLNVFSLYIIATEVLLAPRLGCFNLHPGPLPRYAGLNSMCWAIYHGERVHGVALHKMVPEIDAGPIVYQELIEIGDDDTGFLLAAKCIKVGIPLALRLLEVASQGAQAIPLIPQDPTARQYFGSGPPQDGWVSWSASARHVFNFVRACDFSPLPSPWGHPRCRLGGREIEIVRARLTGKPCESLPGTVGRVTDAGAEVACKDEWLFLRRVLDAGKLCSPSAILKTDDCLEDPRKVSPPQVRVSPHLRT